MKSRLMLALAIATGWCLLMFAPSASADERPSESELLKPVEEWVEAFNRWEIKYPQSSFTDDAVVVDQFPTFLWVGAGSARMWWIALNGDSEQEHERRRALAQHLELGPVQFLQSDGKSAYFVRPATLTWISRGKTHEMKASWIATERLVGGSWRITSHAWAPLTETVR